ncbi:MAG: hypothetical protein ABI873_02700, partial [Marmoricola sp.]
RAGALLADLGLSEAESRRVHTHVGVDIGARTAPELGLSIMAAVVRSIRLEGLVAAPTGPVVDAPVQAVDPICGMTVTIGPETGHLRVAGVEHWFCGPGCRNRFQELHAS